MRIKEIFKRLDLPKHADIVYQILQRQGAMSATDICKRVDLHRPAVYRALSALIKHSFIFIEIKGQRKFYHAANPTLIAAEFSETSDNVSAAIAAKSIADDKYLQREIRFLNGFEGIRAAFDDVIKHCPHGSTFYRYTSEKDLDAVNRYLSKNYRALRDRKKLERMVISNPISGKRKKPRLERFVKFISPESYLFDQNIIQLVYGDRISFIDLNTERVLIIENKMLANFQKVIFQQLYSKLPLP
ncbi:MAG: helix-turn-helix domain-containing protein [Candidatus Buchananbacteria bacterium]